MIRGLYTPAKYHTKDTKNIKHKKHTMTADRQLSICIMKMIKNALYLIKGHA